MLVTPTKLSLTLKSPQGTLQHVKTTLLCAEGWFFITHESWLNALLLGKRRGRQCQLQ